MLSVLSLVQVEEVAEVLEWWPQPGVLVELVGLAQSKVEPMGMHPWAEPVAPEPWAEVTGPDL